MPKKITDKNISKTKKIIKNKKKPTFRGHFGKRSVRRKSKEKWNKWRYPRGADFNFEKADGKKPKSGYRTPKIIRGLHPSGFKEVLVRSIKDLEQIKEKNCIIRISSNIGLKKREMLLKKAMEKKLRVVNA
ncbi:MAG: 50S ribosomal protein L32e [Candidatus Diapherotrites archaeon]|nr:50S ribosomal protein L32e [Candidatus Diapherotrites archaeon]